MNETETENFVMPNEFVEIYVENPPITPEISLSHECWYKFKV